MSRATFCTYLTLHTFGNKISCKAGARTLEHVQAVRKDTRLKISQKGLDALQAIMTLGRRYGNETVKLRDIAMDSDLPENFLELILLELKNARIVESVRGA